MSRLMKGLNWLTVGIFGGAILVAWLQPVNFLGDPDWASPAVTLGLVLGLLVIMNAGRWWVSRWQPVTYRRVLLGVLVLIAVTQLIVALNFIDAARADSYFVRSQAIAIAQGKQTWQHYFMIYPNNVNEVLLEAGFIKVSSIFTNNPWPVLNVLRFLWIDTGLLSGLWLLKNSRHWNPAGLYYAGLWLLSMPIYAYGVFEYTDGLVLPLMIDSLALMVASLRLPGWRRWALVAINGLVIGFGVMMKSNLIVLWIAVVLMTVVLWRKRRLSGRQAGGWLLSLLLTLALMFTVMTSWQRQTGYQKQSQTALPVQSWIMMSLNPKSSGQYQSADFQLINRQTTSQSKKTVAQKTIKQRLQTMGLSGLIVHFYKKFRVFWATGNFDSFKLTSQWTHAPTWYLSHQRTIQFWVVLGTQGLYLAALIQGGWQLLKSRQWQTTFVALTILGLMTFHVLFWEVEGRYALPLLPGLFLLAASGEARLPKLRWPAASRWLVSWFAVVLAGFSLVSLWQTSQATLLANPVVGLQGDGSYVQTTRLSLGSGQTVTTTMPTSGASETLRLSPLGQLGRVAVTLQAGTRRLKVWHGSPKALTLLHYPLTEARSLKLTIKNIGQKTVAYGGIRSLYSPETGQVTTQSQPYLQYRLSRTALDRPLTSSRTSVIMVGGLLLPVLLAIWLIPVDQPLRINGEVKLAKG